VNVTPFDLASCPGVAAGTARATRAALAIIASCPRRWPFDLPSIGSSRLAIAGVGPVDLGRHGVELGVLIGTDLARLSIDGVLAGRLVDAVLAGRGASSTPRALGPAERGVLVGLIGGAFAGLGWVIRADPGPRPAPDSVPILFHLETPAGSGSLRLDVPAGASAGLAEPTQAWRARVAQLPVAAAIEIAATRLAASAVAGLEAGDAIVFDGVPATAFADDSAWRGQLVIRGDKDRYFAPIGIDVDGKLTLADVFSVMEEGDMDATGSGSKIDATTVITAAPIEVVAELGRVTLRGEELLGLTPGAVFPLGAQRRGISLRVGGERWAEGEIVNVDGELGVRVTRLVNR
jgi:flagellar motor switch/type III secretory pathway protein FliN